MMPADYPEGYLLDPCAPFELVEMTVGVREALCGHPPDPDELAGACHEAAHALALGLRWGGWDARWTPAWLHGDPHVVVVVGPWVLDPTAEQFGTGSPVVCHQRILPAGWFDLDLNPSDRAPSEIELICILANSYFDFDRDPIAQLLGVTGLLHLRQAIVDAAGPDRETARLCFCGSESVGARRGHSSVVWACERHLRPLDGVSVPIAAR